MSSGKITIEDVFQRIGRGRSLLANQIMANFLASITSVHVLCYIFLAYPLHLVCVSDSDQNRNQTTTNYSEITTPSTQGFTSKDICEQYQDMNNAPITNAITNNDNDGDCTEFTFVGDGTVNSSIVEDFSLVCDRKSLKYVLQSVFMVGVFLNGQIFGKVSDRIGRRKVIIFMGFMTLLASFLMAFVQSMELFIVLRGLVGLFCFVYPTATVLISESVVPKQRNSVVQAQGIGFSNGFIVLAILAFFIRQWRPLQIATALLQILTILIGWFMMESPRWLLSRGRIDEGMKVLRKMAKSNKSLDESDFVYLDKFEESLKSEEETKPSSENLLDSETDIKKNEINAGLYSLMRRKNLRMLTIILLYTWFATSCAFYGLSLNIASIGGNIYITTIIMGITGGPPVYFICVFGGNKFGRRTMGVASFMSCGICLITIIFLPPDFRVIQIIFFLLGKVFTTVTFGVVYLYTIEVYPTVIRSTVVNFGSSIARVGAVVAPLIAMLEIVSPALPYVVFGLVAFLAGVLMLFLPETNNSPLPESMNDSEEFVQSNPGPLYRILCERSHSKLIRETTI